MSGTHISQWEILERKEVEKSRVEFEAQPEFQSLVEDAARHGFRRITLLEQMEPGTVDAYSWRGGVWVKNL